MVGLDRAILRRLQEIYLKRGWMEPLVEGDVVATLKFFAILKPGGKLPASSIPDDQFEASFRGLLDCSSLSSDIRKKLWVDSNYLGDSGTSFDGVF